MSTNPRRAELRALSAAIRQLVKAGRYDSVNDGLIEHYRTETGQSEFHTFADWRKAGTPVRKGERGFPIWGKPTHLKITPGTPIPDLAAVAMMQGAEPQGPQWFPVAYLFHAGQVEQSEAEHEAALAAPLADAGQFVFDGFINKAAA